MKSVFNSQKPFIINKWTKITTFAVFGNCTFIFNIQIFSESSSCWIIFTICFNVASNSSYFRKLFCYLLSAHETIALFNFSYHSWQWWESNDFVSFVISFYYFLEATFRCNNAAPLYYSFWCMNFDGSTPLDTMYDGFSSVFTLSTNYLCYSVTYKGLLLSTNELSLLLC